MFLANGSFGTGNATRLSIAFTRAHDKHARVFHDKSAMRHANGTKHARLSAMLALSLSSLEDDDTRVARRNRFTRDMAQAKFLALDARLAARLALAGTSLDKGGALGHRGDSLPQGGEFIELLSLEKLGIDGINKFGDVSSGHGSLGSVSSLVRVKSDWIVSREDFHFLTPF